MPTIRAVFTVLLITTILTVTLSGCAITSLLPSSRYRELENFAASVQDGASLTKFEVTQEIGVPDDADGSGDHMESTSWNWCYEVLDVWGHPYRLLVHFNEHALTVAAEFEPAPTMEPYPERSFLP